MNPNSKDTRTNRGKYIDEARREQASDMLLWSGLLLSATLLIICCVVGGLFAAVTTLCVLVLGLTIGVILNGYRQQARLSFSDIRLRAPASLQPLPMTV